MFRYPISWVTNNALQFYYMEISKLILQSKLKVTDL